MITSRNPWRYATTKDECFVAFLHDEDWLRRVLPISRGANEILKRIFHLNPLRRIPLPDLRKEILKLDSFFMSKEELATAPTSVRQALKGARDGISQEAPVVSFDDTTFRNSSSSGGTSSSVSSDEVYVFRSPPDDHTMLPEPGTVPVPVIADVRDSGSLFVGPAASGGKGSESNSQSSGSSADSDGPITPATRPIDPTIEVPDLPEGETLDQSAVIPVFVAEMPKLPPAVRIGKPLWRGSYHVRMALKRLKSLSLGGGSF